MSLDFAPEIRAWYEKKFPGIDFSSNEDFVNAHYRGAVVTLKTLTSIDDRAVEVFEELRPAAYRTVKWQITGDIDLDALAGCLKILDQFELAGPKQIAIAEYIISRNTPPGATS